MPHSRKRKKSSRTKGRTSPGRLSLLDELIFCPEFVHFNNLKKNRAPLLIDFGFGAAATTSIELLQCARRQHSAARVIAIDQDPLRVAQGRNEAKALGLEAKQGIEFGVGNFHLHPYLHAKREEQGAQLIRAMNVLRGYGAHEQIQAQLSLIQCLAPGGIFCEGSCDQGG
ncbi:MAG: hypothetical protein MK135_15090, partial [Polyangiaceae bacterium]|nr:hypothetical protein [Polyangiaceae bacterium]